ncbi:MAG: LysM peptidoglycan-binding domain-containing protein [Phycisphaerales bacterium]|nr:LysM peptidoglycan-binding domain-containing protein [Phycisphaerales bacterium]
MTREQKLALIVGFSLVLVVGVLISDHFSKARIPLPEQGLALDDSAAIGVESDGLAAPLPAAPVALAQDNARASPQLSPPPSAEAKPFEFVMGSTERPELRSGQGPTGERSVGVPGIGLDTAKLVAAANVSEIRDSGAMEPVPDVSTKPGEGATPLQSQKEEAGGGLPVSAGKLARHEVVKNDTLRKIAARYYNDANLWDELKAYNGARVGAKGEVRIGVTVLIPPKDVLIGKASLGAGRGGAFATAPGAGGRAENNRGTPGAPKSAGEKVVTKDAAAGGGAIYTVKSGDTLMKIAARQLGSSGRWREIFALNKGKLDEEGTVKIGMKLKLPAK